MDGIGLTRDPAADAAYVRLVPREIGRGEASETIRIFDHDGDLVGALDLDATGAVLGLELLNAARRLPPSPAPPPSSSP